MIRPATLRRARLVRSRSAVAVGVFGVMLAITAGLPLATMPSPTASAQGVSSVQPVSSSGMGGGDPSISADGRWVVFSGGVGTRRTVFRTDRNTGAIVEMSPVPPGVRAGDTVQAQLSADGCVIVAITEIPFDLFRDDDSDDRFDVYRLVVPECGGQVNGWELVSTADSTGVARDDVFTDSAPAISGSGAFIAYAHPLLGAPDGVATITLVNLTVPINEPGRMREVAGIPAEAPGGAFLYLGARDPALSQNGRHLAFVSDTTASDLLPGWAEGPVLGEYATSQVYVWDTGADNQRQAVRLISGRDGVPAAAGGGEPAMSEDGRIVVFSSRDRTLVPADLSGCSPDCPSQIYRFDRDTDRNGRFDEPARRPQLTLVSAVDAGDVEVGLPIAGDAASWAPAVNADGSQIAFVTDATNLLPSRRTGGGGTDDGDLLVAESQLGEIRRVLDAADLTGVPGAHGNPSLSKTGEVLAFDTMASAALGAPTADGREAVFTATVHPQLSLADLDFGTTLLGFESTELYATVLNAGPAAFEPTAVESSSANFKVTGGTCIRGVIIAAGSSCSVNLTFNPTAPRGFEARLTVRGNGPDAPSVSATLRGAAGDPILLTDPGGVDLEEAVVGAVGGRVAIDIENIDYFPTSISRVEVIGPQADDFRIVTESCKRRALNPDASCAVEIEFTPKGAGYRSAQLLAVASNGAYTTAVLGGFARYEPVIQIVDERAYPGEEYVIGGYGWPANAELSVGFDDGGSPFTTVQAGDTGQFIAILTMPARIRVGPRLLVASGPNGVVASITIDVQGKPSTAIPAVPGFGLG